jgi:chromosome segregation ATPase
VRGGSVVSAHNEIYDETKITIMKNTFPVITFLAIAAFAVGCKPSEEQSTSQQLDKVKTETKADAQQMKDYAFAQKAEFVATMQGQMDALNKDLDALSAKIESSSDAVKAEAKPKLQALRDQAAQLNKQLDDAKNATESTWDSVKAGSEKTYDAMKNDFQQARQWVSDKIAP